MNNEFLKALVLYRNNAGLTQEQASEKLCICLRSLISYVIRNVGAPRFIVNKMSQIYNAPILGYYWLRNTQTGKNILPALAKSSLSENGLCFLDGLNTANECRDDLIKICLDNKIDASEQPRFKKIVEASKDLMKTLMNFTFIK